VRLFPSERPSRTLTAEAGRRVLWRGTPSRSRGLELQGLVADRAAAGTLHLRRSGPEAPLLAFPLPAAVPISAPDVRAVGARVTFAKPQARPPLFRASLRTTHPERGDTWSRGPVSPARRDGDAWRFELTPDDGGRPTGTATALRLELVGFAGESLEMGAVEVLGGEGDDEGFFTYSGDGDTRTVWAGRAGHEIVLHGRVPREGRLRGDVSGERTDLSDASTLVAEVTVEPPRGEAVVGRFPVETSAAETLWVPYELELGALAGEDVTVRLTLRGGARAGGLWTEPVLTGPRDRRTTGIVLVSIDTLRADAVFPPTGEPAMTLLAARARREGQVVRNHYATANWTLPSHASMLSGHYPTAHGAFDRESRPDFAAAAAGYLPAELFREGFLTAAITDGAYVSAGYGFAAGFDEFHESRQWSLGWQSAMLSALIPRLRGQDFFLLVHTYFVHEYVNPGELGPATPVPPELRPYFETERQELRNRLLFWHGQDPIAPSPHPPDPRFAPLLRAIYRERARAFDRWLDGFLSTLARELPGPPLVVVTSDHGESLGEGPGTGVFGHHASLQEDEIRVPLVVFRPDLRPRPDIVDLGSHVDLVPTLRRWIGLPPRPHEAGVDLFDAHALARRREVWSESYGEENRWAAIGRELKVVENVRASPRGQPDQTVFFRGAPGAFDEARPASDGSAEVRAAERRRLDQLYSTVDGLFVQLDNPTPREQTVELRLAFTDREAGGLAEWALPVDLPFQAHLLEAEDDVVRDLASRFACRFHLPAGDSDLLVVKTAADVEIAVAPGAPVVLSNAGTLQASDRTLRASRRTTSALSAPPAIPAGTDAAIVRVWENRPAGVSPRIPQRHVLSENTQEALRALGYLQ
jgi:arylsulfatase A-like enzyme